MQNTHTPLNSTHPILFQKIVRKIVLNPLIATGRFSLVRSLFAKNSLSQHLLFKSSWKLKLMSLLAMVMFGRGAIGQTAYTMSSGNKTWDFIGTWAVSSGTYTGTDAGNWSSVGIIGTGSSVTTGLRTTKSSATIASGTTGGFQKPSGTVQFFSSGSGTTPEAVAIDLLLDFTGRTAGTLSFDWAAIDNTNGTRPTSLRIFWSTNGTTFTEIAGAQLLDKESATSPSSGTISTIALPSNFNDLSTARLRFYNHAGTTATGSGNRDKFQIDNIAITSTASSSSSSNIILNSSFTHPTNIDYTTYQAASGLTTSNSIEVGQFDIQDGGGSSDADAVATTLTACSFTVANSSNIRALALFDGSTNVGEITTVGSTAAFSSLTLAANDNSSKTFSIRATFKAAVTDNHQISFTVASATASSSGSGFAAANAGAAATSTTGDNNRIEVATTDIIFDQNVTTVAQNSVMNPSPTVRAVDGNANYDLDNTSNVLMTISTGLTTFGAATTTVAMVSGVATFSNLIFTTAATANNLTATQGSYTDISSAFNVTASAPEINVKHGATSLVSGSGTYAAGNNVSGNSGSPVTFTIENIGSANLTYSSITNSNTADFTLNTSSTSSPISASGTTTFTIAFNPSTAGAKSTTITINNNDADEGTYTFTVTGTGTVSSASDITNTLSYNYTSNIDYSSFQTATTLTMANSVGVNGLTIRDGGATTDMDNLGTTLATLTFSTGGSIAIRTAALFDGTTNIAEVAVNGATSIAFAGLSLSTSDGGTKDFELRVTYQSTVIDNQQITFTVNAATALSTTSGFATANAGAAASTATSDVNRLEVTATVLAFVQQVSNISINTPMISAPTVSANDANGNRDFDYVTDMTATTTGTFAGASTNTVAPTAGLCTFSNLQFSAAGAGNTIVVSSGSISNTGSSNTFTIYEEQPATQASSITFANVGMNSMTINWTNGSGANRIVVVKASGAPGTSTDGVTYTANTIFGSGSTFGASEYVVYNGSGNTVNITGLTSSTTYSVKVFEYNGSGGTENYITTSNIASQTTIALTYYSIGSGDPAVLANWNSERNGTGSNPINFTSGESFVIESGDVMTTTTTWAISGINSKLQIESGGTLSAGHAITLSSATTFQIDNGGKYSQTAGITMSTIFGGTEVFASNSNFEYLVNPGSTATPSGLGYGNLTITGSGSAALGWGSSISAVQGNLTILSTGTGTTRHALLASGNLTLNIGGDFIISGGNFWLSSGTGPCTINLAGNLLVNGGTLDLANSSGVGTINVGGNVTVSSGTLTEGGSTTTSKIVFNKSGTQIFTSGGTILNKVNFDVASTSILDMGTSMISGDGYFTLPANATLKTAHATGIAGSITVSGTKTFSSAANYEFNGAATGTFTTSPTANTVNDLTINRSAGVALGQNLTVNGTLNLTSGIVTTGANTLAIAAAAAISNAGATTFVNGNLRRYPPIGTVTGFLLPIGDAVNYTPVSIDFAGSVTGTGYLDAVVAVPSAAPAVASGLSQTKYVNRKWTLTNTGITGFTSYAPTFTFVSGDIQGSGTPTAFVIRNYETSAWNTTTLGSALATSTSATGQTTFTDFVIGEKTELSVSTQPSNATICSGNNTTFTAGSTSSPTPSVLWQRDAGTGAGFVNITANLDAGTTYSDFNTNTLSLTGSASGLNGYAYRAVYSNINGSVNSNTAIVTVNAIPVAPSGTAIQNFCSSASPVVSDIIISAGTAIQWHDAATGGNLVTSGTALVTNTHYYASQTVSGCESTSRLDVTAALNADGTWIGGTSTDWNAAANWCGGVPATAANIVIAVNAENDLLLDQNRSVGNIDFNGSTKKIILGTHNLQANALSNYSASSYVKSTGSGKLSTTILVNGIYVFPIGNSSYNPLHITNKTNASDVFSVRVVDDGYVNGINGSTITTPQVDRTWDISKANPNAGTGVDLQFNWNADEVTAPIVNPKMNHFNGTSWVTPTVTSTTLASNSLIIVGYIGSFSPFTVGEEISSLPIELVSFHANCVEQGVALTWQTASEHSSAYFEVERSVDNQNWNVLETVQAAGNSTSLLTYSILDIEHARSAVYYRLKQVDFDGVYKRYDPISMQCGELENEITTYPNPSSDEGFQLLYGNALGERNIGLNILDARGNLLYTKTLHLQKGVNVFNLYDFEAETGIYFLQIQEEENTTTLIRHIHNSMK